jgi:serine/threonine protein phosphatase 1
MLGMFKKLFKGTPPKAQARQRLKYEDGVYSEIYAVGDVHGCLSVLLAAEARIAAARPQASSQGLIIMMGDYVDRGPHSAGVIHHLLAPPPAGLDRICLCGNHDEMFLQFMTTRNFDRAWLDFGGYSTAASYGVDAEHLLHRDKSGKLLKQELLSAVPDAHRRFLFELPVSLEIGPHIFVHAGIVPGRPLEEQNDNDLMWIREPFLSRGSGIDKIVVHGHTPEDKITTGKKRIGIDTGAYVTGRLDVLRIAAGRYTAL